MTGSRRGGLQGLTRRFLFPTSSNSTTGPTDGVIVRQLRRLLAASAGLVSSDNEYIHHLAHYGDTTSVDAQLQTLRALGLDVEFTKEGTPEMIEESISRGAQVLVDGSML